MYSLDMFSPDLCIRRHEWTSTELRALSPYRRILGTNGEDEVLQALDHAVKVRVSGQLGPLPVLVETGIQFWPKRLAERSMTYCLPVTLGQRITQS